MATMLMPASRSDFTAVRNSFSVTAKSPIDYRVLVTTGKCRPSIHPHCIIKINAVDLSRTAEGKLDHSSVRFTTSVKDLVQWTSGNRTDVGRGRPKKRIRRGR